MFDLRVNKFWFYVNYLFFWVCIRFWGVWKLLLDNLCVYSVVVWILKLMLKIGLKFLYILKIKFFFFNKNN